MSSVQCTTNKQIKDLKVESDERKSIWISSNLSLSLGIRWYNYLLPLKGTILRCAKSLVVVQFMWPCGLQAPLFLDSPSKNNGVDCHAPPPGYLPDPGMEAASLMSPALQTSLRLSALPGAFQVPSYGLPNGSQTPNTAPYGCLTWSMPLVASFQPILLIHSWPKCSVSCSSLKSISFLSMASI